MTANLQAGLQGISEVMLKLPTHSLAPSTMPGYHGPQGFKRGLVEAGKEAAWSGTSNAISDGFTAMIDYHQDSYDPGKTGKSVLKHIAKGTGNSLHTGFPGIHLDHLRK